MLAQVKKVLGRAIIAAMFALGLAAGTANAQDAGGASVMAANVHFMPDTLTVPAGTTITWTNGDPFQHTVTADDGTFDSGLIDAGNPFSVTLGDPGVYAYYCIPHGRPGGAGMAGTIVVQ